MEGGRWSGPGSAVVVVCHPCHGAENKEGARPMPHGFVHVVQPLSPSHHQRCPAVAASGTRRAGRGAGWPLGSDTLGRGRAIRDRGRPAAAVFATSSSRKGDQGDWAKGWSRAQSQSRSGRSRRRADLERGEAGWTHALREGGGGSVPCIPSRPRWRWLGRTRSTGGSWRCGTSSVWSTPVR